MSYNFRKDNGIEKINKNFDDGSFYEIPCVLDENGNVDEAKSKIKIDAQHEYDNFSELEKTTKFTQLVDVVKTEEI